MEKVKNINDLCNTVGEIHIGNYAFDETETCNSIANIIEIVKDESEYVNDNHVTRLITMIENSIDNLLHCTKSKVSYIEYARKINYVLLLINGCKISSSNKHNLLFFLAILSVNVSELYVHKFKNNDSRLW
jgi:hypothetical protein